jgi:hypothetical protein
MPWFSSWSWSAKAKTSEIDEITSDLQKISNTTFITTGGLAKKVNSVWEKARGLSSSQLTNEKAEEIFVLCTQIKEKESNIASWYQSWWPAIFGPAKISSPVTELHRWNIERAPIPDDKDEKKKWFAEGLVASLGIDTKENQNLVEGIKAIKSKYLSEFRKAVLKEYCNDGDIVNFVKKEIIIRLDLDENFVNNLFKCLGLDVDKNQELIEKLQSLELINSYEEADILQNRKQNKKFLNDVKQNVLSWIDNGEDVLSKINQYLEQDLDSSSSELVVEIPRVNSDNMDEDNNVQEGGNRSDVESLVAVFESFLSNMKGDKADLIKTFQSLSQEQQQYVNTAMQEIEFETVGDVNDIIEAIKISLDKRGADMSPMTTATTDSLVGESREKALTEMEINSLELMIDLMQVNKRNEDKARKNAAQFPHVHPILNGAYGDKNRCFINAVFQLIMHTPSLCEFLLYLLENYSYLIDPEDVQAYECLKKSIESYHDKNEHINLSPLRQLLLKDQGRAIGTVGEARALLTRIFSPFMNLEEVGEIFPSLSEDKKYQKILYFNKQSDVFFRARDDHLAIPSDGVKKNNPAYQSTIACPVSMNIANLFQEQQFEVTERDRASPEIFREDGGDFEPYVQIGSQNVLHNTPKQLVIEIPKNEGFCDNWSLIDIPPFLEVPSFGSGSTIRYKLVAMVLQPYNGHYTAIVVNPNYRGEEPTSAQDIFNYPNKWTYVDDYPTSDVRTVDVISLPNLDMVRKGVTLLSYEKVEG